MKMREDGLTVAASHLARTETLAFLLGGEGAANPGWDLLCIMAAAAGAVGAKPVVGCISSALLFSPLSSPSPCIILPINVLLLLLQLFSVNDNPNSPSPSPSSFS